jgi:hypothetical protein
VNGFSWKLILVSLTKFVSIFQFYWSSDNNKGHFTWRPTWTLRAKVTGRIIPRLPLLPWLPGQSTILRNEVTTQLDKHQIWCPHKGHPPQTMLTYWHHLQILKVTFCNDARIVILSIYSISWLPHTIRNICGNVLLILIKPHDPNLQISSWTYKKVGLLVTPLSRYA